jgi:hypothetical protein
VRSLIIFIFTECHSGDQISEDEMGLGHLGVDGGIILKLILNMEHVD